MGRRFERASGRSVLQIDMSTKTILTYIIAIGVSGAMAFAVYKKADRASDRPPPPAVKSPIDDPLWYRTADPAVRLAGAQKRLQTMTTTAISAAEVGPSKDEIALLCRDERIVDAVVESFRRRKDFSSAELSAFMEIFSRVRHERFAPLFFEGINHPRFEARLNAIDAAIVQQHPGSARLLADALKKQVEYEALKIIEALARIGTPEAYDAIVRAIDAPDDATAIHAIRAAGQAELREAIPRLRRRLEADDPEVGVIAAWALAALGQDAGRRRLAAAVRDRKLEGGVRAQAVQFLVALGGDDLSEILRGLAADEDEYVSFEARIGLAKQRDAETLGKIRADLDAEDAVARETALAILGATGFPADVALVHGRLEGMSDRDIEAFLHTTRRGRAPGVGNVLLAILPRGGRIAQAAMTQMTELGDEGVEALARLLEDDPPPRVLGAVVSALGSSSSARALEVLESIDLKPDEDRRLWLFVRKNIRAVDLRRLKL